MKLSRACKWWASDRQAQEAHGQNIVMRGSVLDVYFRVGKVSKMKERTKAAWVACGAMGIYQNHVVIHELNGKLITWTKGRERTKRRSCLAEYDLIVPGHVEVTFPKGYKEEHVPGAPGLVVQWARFCMFDARYKTEFIEWKKDFLSKWFAVIWGDNGEDLEKRVG
jgi:hypothetical protein